MTTASPLPTPSPLKNPIKTEFAVDMTCTSCVSSLNSALRPLPGIKSLDISLPNKTVIIEGTTPPSTLLERIKSTGLAAVLRGQGSQSHLGAAVCIFESFAGAKGWAQNKNKGLARLVQVDDENCLVDVTVEGVPPGKHTVAIHECGDISGGCASTGAALARLGILDVDENGKGSLVSEARDVKIWDMIGRSIVLDRKKDSASDAMPSTGATCGIIARSAGVFQNPKVVCSCSGQTLWEESKL
ncbi:copper chaperone [Rhizophlyctis rosea]|uniref:Superoxide dismutase 1 copper chaperone n=1 Tax=Rhizophlyctis rosea TaxID=64517 RepID=A0AAD5SQP3_9FUNG|nr:copper chaperone [Rhizophlyctis rosea]